MQQQSKVARRLWSKVDKSQGEEACWLWTSTVSRGRARFYFQGTSVNAARVAYLLEVGEIPEGMEVCHHCDNMMCLNPKHLFLGTHKENMNDMLAKGRERYLRGEELPNTKLTAEKVREIRKQASEGVPRKELAKRYNVDVSTIHEVVNRKTWKHVS